MKKRYMAFTIIGICVVMIIAVLYTIPQIITEPAEVTTIENKAQASGFIVRDETMYYATTDGTIYFGASEGERIPRDSQIAIIFEGDVNSDSIKELSVIDTKLDRAQESETEGLVHKSSTGSVENDIMTQVENVYDYAQDNDVRKIARTREAINSLRTEGEYNPEDESAKLEDEKWHAIQNIGSGRKEIYTALSGVFSTYLDGLESVLTPSKIEQYSPSYIKQLSNTAEEESSAYTVKTGDPICKVMNNHVWYTLVVLNSEESKKCEEGGTVTLRFKNMANSEVDADIEYISDADENGDRLVLIRCTTYVESVFSYRRADVDIIFESYTGYKVPINAIRTDSDKQYVYGRSGGTSFMCEINVLYTDKDGQFAVIESTENAKNKLSRASEIIINDMDV